MTGVTQDYLDMPGYMFPLQKMLGVQGPLALLTTRVRQRLLFIQLDLRPIHSFTHSIKYSLARPGGQPWVDKRCSRKTYVLVEEAESEQINRKHHVRER